MWFIHVLCCVVLSHSVMSNSLWPLGLYSTRLLYPWGFSRKEYWSGLPCLPPGDLPDPRIEPGSPTLQADPLLSEPPGKPMNMGVGSQSLLQGIFLTQKSSWGLLHCRRILYQLSYQGSPIFVPVVVIQLLSRVRLSLQPHGIQYNRLPCSSSSSRACSNLCSSRWWYHSTISSSVIPFSSYLQSFPASESFLMSQLFSSGGQSIGVSASASVPPPVNIQDWLPLGLTGLISLQKTLKSLLWYHSSKASIFWHSAIFMVHLSHPYMTTEKNHSFD